MGVSLLSQLGRLSEIDSLHLPGSTQYGGVRLFQDGLFFFGWQCKINRYLGTDFSAGAWLWMIPVCSADTARSPLTICFSNAPFLLLFGMKCGARFQHLEFPASWKMLWSGLMEMWKGRVWSAWSWEVSLLQIVAAAVYVIWKERNLRVFQGCSSAVDHVSIQFVTTIRDFFWVLGGVLSLLLLISL